MREYLSAFTFTGGDQRAQEFARAETARVQRALPLWIVRPGRLRGARWMMKVLAGVYRSGPIEYDVYASEDDERAPTFGAHIRSFVIRPRDRPYKAYQDRFTTELRPLVISS